MRRLAFLSTFVFCSFLVHAREPLFFLSSDPLFQKQQESVKEFSSFVFFPLLKIEEKQEEKTIELIDQELKKIGCIIKKQVLTSDGADMECFSNPTLQFSVEQLVDSNNDPLSVLQASLSIRAIVRIGKANEMTSLNTNIWSVYLKKTNDVQKIIKKSLPLLLSQFITEFKKSHPVDEKPIFYITYDNSCWKIPAVK